MEDQDVLTPLINSQDLLCSQEQISVPENPNAWGRLYPENKFLKIEDLVKDNYKAGRQTNNVDLKFTEKCFNLNVMYHISKIHFTITREIIGSLGYVVYISDTSSNGTYVNGEKIGKDCRWVLSNNDKIAVVSKINNVYTYTDKQSGYSSCPQKVSEQFAVYGILGTGTYGEVRLAFEKKTLKCFALKKVIKKRSCVVFREPDILSSLSHPNIVNMENFIDTSDAIYIGLEYMPGGTLKQLVENSNRLKESETKIILYQVARAVQYLHNRSIVHRDLKPGNILLSKQSPYCHVKLADFGLSKKITDNTLLKTFCGSFAYIAPEVIFNGKKFSQNNIYTNKVDSWSFGVILYQCLIGCMPFSGENVEEKICKGVYSTWLFYNISNEAQNLIKQLLTVDCSLRFDFDKILKHFWFEKDVLMKQKVNSLICKVPNGITSSIIPFSMKENSIKRFRFCPCLR